MVLERAGEYPMRRAAVEQIAAKIGCAAQTLHDWTKKQGNRLKPSLSYPACAEVSQQVPVGASVPRWIEAERESGPASRTKIGATSFTPSPRTKKAEVDSGTRAGVATGGAEKLKALERLECENREPRQADETLRRASAYFARAELDRPF